MFWFKQRRGDSGTRSESRTFRTTRLRCEQLEFRRMMAGVVTAQVASGNLQITGQGDDVISLVGGQTAGDVTIQGSSGTVVNGIANGAVTIHGVTGGITIGLGNGNNVVAVDGMTLNGDLSITTGSGSDIVAIGTGAATTVLGSVSINTGAGDDVVGQGNFLFIAGTDDIETAAGADAVYLNHVSCVGDMFTSDDAPGLSPSNYVLCTGVATSNNLGIYADCTSNTIEEYNSDGQAYLYIELENGQNTVTLANNYSAGYIDVEAGTYVAPGGSGQPGNYASRVSVTGCYCLGLEVSGGAGNDTITLTANYVADQPAVPNQPETESILYCDASLGNDTVVATGNYVQHDMAFTLSDGNDSLALTSNTVLGSAIANGNSGVNTLSQSNNNFHSPLYRVNI